MRPTAVLAVLCVALLGGAVAPPEKTPDLFARKNLWAWCIVPFDSKNRSPEERAAMLEKLGFTHFAYDWRAEHIPTFDAEIEALKKHHVALDAFWAPGVLNKDTQTILDVLKRHHIKTQLWVLLDQGPDKATGAEQERRVKVAAAQMKPLALEAAKAGCTLGLYNHGGWYGEPENQVAIIERLKKEGVTNLGIVYNLHHGHDHLDRFPTLLQTIKPYLLALNLNGMDPGGDRVGRKILPLGQGELDLGLLKTIRDSGYTGPIGILGHTQDDAEQRLQDNLDGLDWLVPQLDGKPPGPKPTPRTPVPPRPAVKAAATPGPNPLYSPEVVATLLNEARTQGDPKRGAEVFASATLACVSCHKVGAIGGTVGPDLSASGACLAPELIVESLLWPKKTVKDGYHVLALSTKDGRIVRGYPLEETKQYRALRDPSSGERIQVKLDEIEESRDEGSLMPEALTATLTPVQRRDLIRFLLDLGRAGGITTDALKVVPHSPAEFVFDRKPLRPDLRTAWTERVNRERPYDFYEKEAEAFVGKPEASLLPQFPGLDGGKDGHWGNQNEDVWADDRWGKADLGTLLGGIFRGNGLVVPKGVCLRLGDKGELSACFNPETLCYEALWQGGFVKFTTVRHGFMDGLVMDGTALPRPEGKKPTVPFVYHGYYRHGKRVVFSYSIDGVEMLDAPWVKDGKFERVVGPAQTHPLAHLTRGGAPQWPQTIATKGTPGTADSPYVVDTIGLPTDNPWKALLFFGDHDFLADGTGLACTMQGDVWSISGLDDRLQNVRWRRFASGLHQALGLVVADGKAHVLGRDQITRLHDLDGDGEADFYECVSNAYTTSPAGHDFICGLQRDSQGRFYTSSGPQGLIRISADGRTVETVASGLRNPDGLGLSPDGVLTVPNSEGEWTPASMVCEVGPGTFFGYKGPRNNRPPDLPLVYMPRGLDNSSGGQVTVTGNRFGPLEGQLIHFSFGAGTYFLVLRERVDGQPQGAAVPLPGEFRSGSHRGRFNPKDGQLYVSGMAGWGSYTPDDGSFQRVRYTGKPAQLPVAIHSHQNGILLTFSEPLDRSVAERADRQFVQAWNYKYSQSYGSSEWSTKHPGVTGHDRLPVRSSHVLADGKSLFLEIPDLQPANQVHLHLRVDGGPPQDLFATVHKLAGPFTGFTGYQPVEKVIAAHPILADMASLNVVPVPNPFKGRLPNARGVNLEAGKNLTYSLRSFTVKKGEAVRLTFMNPDVVPHNWALLKPGTLSSVGNLVNRVISEPDAASRQYIPRTPDVLAYTDIVGPGEQFTIHFKAPESAGVYPYLCTFPGHWMVMNGTMVVE